MCTVARSTRTVARLPCWSAQPSTATRRRVSALLVECRTARMQQRVMRDHNEARDRLVIVTVEPRGETPSAYEELQHPESISSAKSVSSTASAAASHASYCRHRHTPQLHPAHYPSRATTVTVSVRAYSIH